MSLSITYIQQNAATLIKSKNNFFTSFYFSVLQEWEYQYRKIDEKQLRQS